MDDLGSLIFVGIAIAAAVFVAWVVLALFMRMLALFVFYWIVSFSAGLIAGLIAGLLIPLRVLSGKASVKPAIATPDKVVDNKVMKIPPRGMQKHFGWDRAWPVYNPYQARLDALAVTAEYVVPRSIPKTSPDTSSLLLILRKARCLMAAYLAAQQNWDRSDRL